MAEKREEARGRTLKGGRIVFAGTPAMDCTIRHRSKDGAQLKALSIVGIPDQLVLHENATGERHAVTVIWRKVRVLGVKLNTP